jgi:hypothetical protein
VPLLGIGGAFGGCGGGATGGALLQPASTSNTLPTMACKL